MPRSRSIAIQSERVERRSRLALTWPARLMAPPNSKSFSVSVVLPASGWEMMAKVRRRSTSTASGVEASESGRSTGLFMGRMWQGKRCGSRVAGFRWARGWPLFPSAPGLLCHAAVMRGTPNNAAIPAPARFASSAWGATFTRNIGRFTAAEKARGEKETGGQEKIGKEENHRQEKAQDDGKEDALNGGVRAYRGGNSGADSASGRRP